MTKEQLREQFKQYIFAGGKYSDLPEHEADEIADYWINKLEAMIKEAVEEERKSILENVVYDLDRLNSDWKAKVEWIGSELQRYKDEYSEDLQALHPNSKDEIINKDN